MKWDGSAWLPWAATLCGNTVTYTVTDNIGAGGAFTGDTNPTAGVIDDPVMLALFTASSMVAIPTLSEWGLLITSLLLAALAVAHHLRRQRRSTR